MRLSFYKRKIRRFLTLFVILGVLLWSIEIVSARTLPYLESIATYQVKSYVNTLLRECIDNEFEGIGNQKGAYDVVTIRKQVTKLVKDASVLLEESKSEIIYELPIGALTKSVWLMNWGPKIPIRMRMLQAVNGEVTSKVEEYGLNNALLTIQVQLEVEVEVLSPYPIKTIRIQSEIPLVIDVREGPVPIFLPS